MKALTFLARRFVAGETARRGHRRRPGAARPRHQAPPSTCWARTCSTARPPCAAREANKDLLRRIPPEVERNISIKLTMMGLDISEDFCLEQAAGILDVAREVGGFVRIDMEGSKHTQRTLDVFHTLREDYDNVGIVLQAYLHRTEDDVKEAIAPRRPRAPLQGRLQGAARDRAARTWTTSARATASCAHLLLDKGNYPAIATHDESLVQDVLGYAREPEDPARPLRVPDALRPAPAPLGRAGGGRATTCASTCPTGRTGSRTSTGACASARRTSSSCCGACSAARGVPVGDAG